MNTQPGRTSRGRIPAGLLGALVCVAAVEWSLGRFVRHMNLVANGWRLTARAAAREEVARSEILCFGDSQMKLGLQPRVVEARLNRKAYNLAMIAGPSPTSYVLLRRALDAGSRPRAIVVDFFPALFKVDPYLNLDRWADVLTLREAVELSLAARDPSLPAHLLLQRALRSYKGRAPIRAAVLAALRGSSASPRESVLVQRRNLRENLGACLNPAQVGEPPHETLDETPAAWEKWYCYRVNQTYVHKFLELAAARGIPVFCVVMPCEPVWQARQDRFGLQEAYDTAFRSLLKRYPNMTVLDGRHSGYAGVFKDDTHLDRVGACALSADVADVVGQALDGHPPRDRWVRLPAFRPPALGSDLEDVEQSRVVLRQQGVRR